MFGKNYEKISNIANFEFVIWIAFQNIAKQLAIFSNNLEIRTKFLATNSKLIVKNTICWQVLPKTWKRSQKFGNFLSVPGIKIAKLLAIVLIP